MPLSKTKTALAGLCLVALTLTTYAQTPAEEHTVVLGKDIAYTEGQHFKQGSNKNPQGVELDLNNYYLRAGGKPILPVMGEIHYSRYPRAEWEQALLQMKAAGINTIAFYCFWIHHEQEEGHFRFDDNLDVRYFTQLCAKHGLKGLARIGPWAHGEARNGGYPDWFVKKKMKSGSDRVTKGGSVAPEVADWYKALAGQFKGLYYKDGGPLIGIQLDNEMRSNGPGSDGYEYLSSLKKLAVADGMDVPFYVVTGWPGPVLPENEVLPMEGGYPDAPWTGNTKDLPPNGIYTFGFGRRDKNIGTDILSPVKEAITPTHKHPFLTVELGGGMQITYHRRPTLQAADLLALDYTRLGVGVNMLGYYVFHGTQHPLSWNKEYPTQESKATLYPYANDYPMISYDFEAPLTEWGYIRDYYHDFKLFHVFVNSYGENLAPMQPQVPLDNPSKPDNLTDLRYTIRSAGGAGYVFFNNYVRHFDMANHPGVVFNIKTLNETIRIPEKGSINIKNGAYGVMPFNFNMDGVLLKYATAHPITILHNKNKVYCYYAMDGLTPQFKFENRNIKTMKLSSGVMTPAGPDVIVDGLIPGKNCTINITTKTGESFQVLLLTHEQAKYSYVFDIKGTQTLLLTANQAFYDEVKDELTIRSTDHPSFTFDALPAVRIKNKDVHPVGVEGLFSKYSVKLPQWKPIDITYKQLSVDSSFDRYTASLAGKTPLGPTYGIKYDAKLPYKSYAINMPSTLPKNVHDVLVEFDYKGNTAALYANGLIVADDYYTGNAMPYSLIRNADLLVKPKFILQITPLMESSQIHFEPGTELGFTKTNHAELKGVHLKPQYEVVF
jgi:beta-galactosidase